ncbi:peptide transporter [Metamycoplasma hominis]|uniref:protein translocase subunit SecDF n=1 Tax=Metamycoplasma hominis TaxID=2098 RepID=UPI00158E6C69|nr:peptide transporter [Metamycoplasma hominis]QKX41037.1 peptide transporter [Metamycoplasma hominis]UIU37929.1 peptide transporter [Metamycoplasma hominis]
MKKTKILNNKFRWVISIFLILILLIVTILGSIFYLFPQLKKQSNSNVTSAKIGLKIERENQKEDSYKKSYGLSDQEILNLTKNYIGNQNGVLSTSYDINLVSKNLISATSYQDKTDKDVNNLISNFVNKPYLTVTDGGGNPLFYKGEYVSRFYPNPDVPRTLKDFLKNGPQNYNISVEKNPATTYNKFGARQKIQVKLDEYGWDSFVQMINEYMLATNLSLQRNRKASREEIINNPGNKIYFWMNLAEFIRRAKTEFPDEWKAAGENPINFAYVGNSALPEIKKDKKGNIIDIKYPVLKSKEINARKYLISAVNPATSRILSTEKNESSFYLANENLEGLSDEYIAAAINYSYAPFKLTKTYNYFLTGSSTNQNRYLAVLAILFSLFAVFLIAKYRLYGIISSICLAFMIFVFLSIITSFNIYITGAVAFTFLVSTFLTFLMIWQILRRLDKEVNSGSNGIKATNKSLRFGIISTLDIAFALIVVSIFTIFIKTSYLNAMGIMLFIGLVSGLIIGVLVNALIMWNLIKTETFDKRTNWIVWNSKRANSLIAKIDLISKSKYFSIGFAIFVILTIVFFGIYSGVFGNTKLGINASETLANNYLYSIQKSSINGDWNKTEVDQIIKYWKELNISNANIFFEKSSLTNDSYNLLISSADKIDSTKLEALKTFINTKISAIGNEFDLNIHEILLNANGELINFGFTILIIAVSLIICGIYSIIRFGLIAFFVMWINEILAVISSIVWLIICHGQFNNGILGALILSTAFSVVDSISNSQTIKEEFGNNLNTKNYIFEIDQINNIFKKYVIESLNKNIFNIFFAIIFVASTYTLMTGFNATTILVTSMFIISNSFINLFILPNIWRLMYIKRYSIKQKRIETKYWETEKISEQTFVGINDFNI